MRWGEYLFWIPGSAVGAAFVSWVFMLATPLAVLPDLFGVSQGTIVMYAALGGALFALIGPLFVREPKPKKAVRSSKPATKPPAPRASADVDDEVPLTRRQQQHLWYGDNRDLDWRDREQAEAWGMDADTYKSDWLESD